MNISWTIKQLLPLKYRTRYSDIDGHEHAVVWRMWFGRCFHVFDEIIG